MAREGRAGPVEIALGHFLQEVSDTKALHEIEINQRNSRIEALSKQVQSATALACEDENGTFALVRPTANPAVERIKQRLTSLSEDLVQTAKAAAAQETHYGEAKAELQAAKLSYLATPTPQLRVVD